VNVCLVWSGLIAVAAALAVTAARSQDLDAGKTGPQLFAQDCSACHRSPQGLSKNLAGGSLVSFLRQHYTSSAASANTVAAYLQAAGPGSRAERPKDRAERQKDLAKQAPPAATQPLAAQPPQAQPSPPPGRTRVVRPSEPIPSVPSAAAPETHPPAPAAKKRERVARPLDPAANPQAPPSQGRRKARRPGHAEPTAAAPVPEMPDVPAYPPPPPNFAPAAPAATEASPPAATGSATEGARPRSAAPAQPSFVEPLP